MPETLATAIARTVDARLHCIETSNVEWKIKHGQRLGEFCMNHLPSGSGWDSGTEIDLTRSTGERLVFIGSYHHMDEHGSYDGWTDHDIIVTPSLRFGFDVRVTGRDRNDIKEYLTGLFLEALSAPAPEHAVKED